MSRNWNRKKPVNQEWGPLKLKKLHPDAKLPTKGSSGSAGLDIYALEDVAMWPGDIRALSTGLALEIPPECFGLLITRSSMGLRGVRLSSGANIIDADYRGELLVSLRNDGENLWEIKKGERIAQIVITPYLSMNPIWVEELSETQRGTGGFGSTGR